MISGIWRWLLLAAMLAVPLNEVSGAGFRNVTIPLRGKPQPVVIYESGKATQNLLDVLVVSGDVGWIGLPVTIAEHLQFEGFRVIGFNARTYLAAFTNKPAHLQEQDVPQDFQTLLRAAGSLESGRSAIVIGVSEGAGLAVLALGQTGWAGCRGLLALGMPEKTSLGWRWIDFTMWITKTDPKEAMANTAQYLPHLNVPLFMIHSIHDEWDSIDRARGMYQLAPEPKRMREIDASNHRFSNRIPVLLSEVDRALQWFRDRI